MNEPRQGNVVECAECGVECELTRPVEDMEAEFRAKFPRAAAAAVPKELVCESCYRGVRLPESN